MNRQKTVRILTYFYIIPLGIMMIFNTFNSLIRTTYFELYSDMETAKYRFDNPLAVLLITVFVLAISYFFLASKRIKDSFSNKGFLRLSLIYAGTMCLFVVLLFRCEVTCDSEFLSDIAIQFIKGNYDAFRQGEYLYQYSFQIGMTAFIELFYRIFGIENYVVFQLINTGCIIIFLYMLNRITGELFDKCEDIQRAEILLSFGMFPLFLFSTFIYGDIIGWTFGTSAIYFVIRYLKTDRMTELIKTALLIMLGVTVKSNINILMTAILITLVLNCIVKKEFKPLVFVLLIPLISQAGVKAIEYIYVKRAGLSEYPAGIPKIAWIAMSMQETDEGGYAPGWYNAYNWDVYVRNGYDRALTVKECIEDLKGNLGRFLHEQRYALNFFYKKFTSQWNAPTFQAMITNEWGSRHVDNLSSLAGFFIYEKGHDILYGIMNIYHFIIFLCASIGFYFERKKWSLVKAYFLLNIFGGFIFHMLWEAQSRYILGYFVLMLPVAACGLFNITDAIRKHMGNG